MTQVVEGAATTSVLWHVFMSVDGFIARPGDDMRWVFDYKGPNDAVEDPPPTWQATRPGIEDAGLTLHFGLQGPVLGGR